MRPRLAVFCKFGLLLLALSATLPQSVLALTASQVYEQVKDSVVVVKAYDQQGKPVGLGSGVMLPSGDVITNYHVVEGGVRYTVGRGTKAMPATVKEGEVFDIPNYWVPATVKACDPKKDLCLLTAPDTAPGLTAKPGQYVLSDTLMSLLTAKPARLGQAARLKVGEPVYAVGAPQGLELSLSEGIVSQLRGGPPPLIQTTVAISKGSSGGGLFSAEGELVGIATFYLKDSQSLNFALPVEWIGEVARGKIRERPIGEATDSPEPGAKPKEIWDDRADAFKKAQDWQGLLAHCRRWTQAEPGNALAWYSLGVAYVNLGSHREAVEAFREALRLKPDDADAWNNLGVTYDKLGSYREAIAAYREALRLKPDNAKAWYNLGVTYSEMDRHREEIEAYREALRLKPDYAKAWNNLALAYAQSGNRSAALQAVRELRRYDPQQADKLFNLIMKP